MTQAQLFDAEGLAVQVLPPATCRLCGNHAELITGLPDGPACRPCARSEDEYLLQAMARSLHQPFLTSRR